MSIETKHWLDEIRREWKKKLFPELVIETAFRYIESKSEKRIAELELKHKLEIEAGNVLEEKIADLEAKNLEQEARIGYIRNLCWENHSGILEKNANLLAALRSLTRTTESGEGWIIPTLAEVESVKRVLAL